MAEPAAKAPEEKPAPAALEPEPALFSLPSFLRALPPPKEPRHPLEWKVFLRWLPIFLLLALLGGWLGTQGAHYLDRSSGAARSTDTDAYSLGLAVSEYGDNLHLSWNRQAPALRQARRGVLIIGDGEQTRTLELDGEQLRSGSVTYRPTSSPVRFRLELYLTGNRTLSEAWESPPEGTAPPERP